MADYEKKVETSGVAKGALATAIGVGALTLLGGGGILNNGALAGMNGGIGAPVATAAAFGAAYVSERELGYVRELAAKDSQLAQANSVNYTNQYVTAMVEPMKQRICELEKNEAVNAARDHDYRCYADREFVHQPKTSMHNSTLVTKPCECCCEKG